VSPEPYTVVWNGTRSAACGTPYLAATAHQTYPTGKPAPAEPTLRSRVIAVLEVRGPSTIREVADVLAVNVFRVNSAVANMHAAGVVRVVAQRSMNVARFGSRQVAVYGLVRA
jgi:hypothetical protein